LCDYSLLHTGFAQQHSGDIDRCRFEPQNTGYHFYSDRRLPPAGNYPLGRTTNAGPPRPQQKHDVCMLVG